MHLDYFVNLVTLQNIQIKWIDLLSAVRNVQIGSGKFHELLFTNLVKAKEQILSLLHQYPTLDTKNHQNPK